ncbi:MAG TPA: FUSC family protein [Gemmatimonadaceae bacterium]|nr:FUSC family protein [Gemmatimonadaceae bacterium]
MIRQSFVRRTLHDARVASVFAHARPAYAAGVRAAIATVSPLLLSHVLPDGGASWMSLAGLNGALIDRGGPYRTRAATMSALAVASAVAVLIGTLIAGHVALSVAVTFVVGMICGLARAWTDVGPGFGVTIFVSYAIALAIPAATTSSALARAGYILVGGMWALLLAIILWPLRPYRPVRLRVAECYRAIARYMEAAQAELTRRSSYDPSALTSHVIAVREAIESARTALAVSRRGRSGESARGERLLVLHEVADQIFAHVIALLEESDATLNPTSSVAARESLGSTVGEMAAMTRALATAIISETDVPRVSITWSGASLRPMSASLALIVDRITDYAITATELTASLNSGDRASAVGENIEVSEPPPEPVLFSLAAVMRPSSVVLHHALRVAIVASSAVLIAGLLHLNHGYWVTLTAVVILQPFAATTRQKALQRVIGTMLGGAGAAAASALFHSTFAVLVLVAIFTMLCVALLPLNYGAFAVFGTPAFVLLAEASVGDWHLAGLRIVNTLIGGILALIAASVLWPNDERSRLPELAAAAIRANDELLRRATALVGNGGAGDVGALRDARRDIAFAAFNAEDSFQRLVSEHRGPPETLEPIMAFLVYTRRLAASSAALAVAASGDAPPSTETLRIFEQASHAVLTDLADAVIGDRPPAPFPALGKIVLPDASEIPPAHQRLTRIARQLKQIHDAVSRWISPTTHTTVPTREWMVVAP